MTDYIRLNKHLAHQTGISRREADNLIADGRVTVDGQLAVLGARITDTNQVTVDKQLLQATTQKRYILFHKPVGYICSRRSQSSTPTIYSLLPKKFHSLKPVGRLDKDSSGLLFLTNDGDFAFRMTHPSFHKQKVYQVTLEQDLEPIHQQMINEHRVLVDERPSRLALERLDETSRKDWQVIMSEGRNRQIRRTFEALGYTISTLHRTNFGNYTLGDIAVGQYLEVDIP